MRRTSRWLTIGISSLFVGALLGGVVAAFLFYSRGVTRYLSSGESSYQTGLKSVQAGQPEKAMVSFHEAMLQAENVLKETEEPAGQTETHEQYEKRQRLLGQAYWLKYRALKARGFTRMLVDKQPLPTFEGQAEGSPDVVLTRLSPLRLPEETIRREAISCLREAAYRLPGSIEALSEAIGMEVQIEPMQWNFIHAFATTLGELDPKDERARYLLARLEYEQPVALKTENGSATLPLPTLKRSRDRMHKGLEHIAKLKETEQPIRWRTIYLEAQIHAWLVQYYRQPTQRKVDLELEELQKLRVLLLDAQHGVLAKATMDDRLAKASRLDVQGVYGLLQMALELVLDDSRHANPATTQPDAQRPWVEQTQKVMDVSMALVNKTKANGRLADAADFLVQATLKAMPTLAESRPEVWAGYRDQVLEIAKQAQAENVTGPLFCHRLADLLIKESQWQQQLGKTDLSIQRREEATRWLEEGLKEIGAKKLPVAMALPLHEAKLRLLISQGAKRETLRPHLEALRNSRNGSYQAVAAFFEGAILEKEGRLDAARQLLEQSLSSGRTDLTRRSLTMLVPIYLTLEMPAKALKSLNDLERTMTRIETMNPEERTWYHHFIRSPQDLAVMYIHAHVQAAEQAHARMPGLKGAKEKELTATIAQHESQIKERLEKLPGSLPVAAQARIAWAQYLLHRERLDEFDKEIAILKRDHPHLLETVQLEVDRLVVSTEKSKAAGDPIQGSKLPPATITQADAVIERYLKAPKANPAARLMWLKWLSNTGRAAEAQKLLHDPAFFADAVTDPAVQKIKALAQIYCGPKEQTTSVIDALPRDPMVDVALLQAAATTTEQQEVLSSAIRNYQDAGLFRAWSAALSLARGDHAEACRSFLACMEFTRARPLVRQGLTEALLAWAQHQPLQARKLAAEGLQHYPTETGLLLGFAFASLQLGELGSPADGSDQVKDMATALKAFEAACQTENRDPSLGPWVQAQFWLLAQRPDLARLEVARTLDRAPKHEGALLLAIKLFIERNDPAHLAQAQKCVDAYQQLHPQAPEGIYWQAQVLERAGKKNEAMKCYHQLMDNHPRFAAAYPESADLLLKANTPESIAACKNILDRWRTILPTDPALAQTEVRYHACQGKLPETRQLLDQRLAQLEMKNQSDQPIQTVGASSDKQKQQLLSRIETTRILSQGLIQASQLQEAEKWLAKNVEAMPDHEPSLLLLGEVQVKQMLGQPAGSTRTALAKKAADTYLSIYKRRKGHPLVGNNLAWLLVAELNDPAEAYRIAQEVRMGRFLAKPMPGDLLSADFLDTLGLIYLKSNRSDLTAERIELFEAARRRYPQDPRVFLHLGHSYLAAKENRRGAQALEIARTLAHNSQDLTPSRKESLKLEIEQALTLKDPRTK